jgi:hypothetical protein
MLEQDFMASRQAVCPVSRQGKRFWQNASEHAQGYRLTELNRSNQEAQKNGMQFLHAVFYV